MIDILIERAWYDCNRPVLQNFRMCVEKGETVAIIGESGIGKSTLLKIIAGLHKNYEGWVNTCPEARIAMIPQNKCLLPWKTVRQNIGLLKFLEKEKPDDNKLRLLMEKLGILELAEQFPLRLSGGQYQRVALGQAFFYEPDIILMDEPFSALDAETKTEIQTLFLDMQKRQGITALFVTHNIGEAEYMKSRVVKLEGV